MVGHKISFMKKCCLIIPVTPPYLEHCTLEGAGTPGLFICSMVLYVTGCPPITRLLLFGSIRMLSSLECRGNS